MDSGTDSETKGMVTRLIDYLKAGQVTSLFTSLTQSGHALQQSEKPAMSSLMDSWMLLQDFEGNGEDAIASSMCSGRAAWRTQPDS